MDQNAPPEVAVAAAEPSSDFLNRSLFNASLDSSALSTTNCSPGGVNPRRRESKSRAEKKRRDRINVCFQRMHQLLEDEFKCRSPSTSLDSAAAAAAAAAAGGLSPGAEKAEILEQMIRFVESLKRQRKPVAMDSKASTPERSRTSNGSNADDSLIKSYMSGYKRGIQNIFILIDRLCHESERLTKTELIEKIKKGYLDNATGSPAIEQQKSSAAAAAVTADAAVTVVVCRPALGDLSNNSHSQHHHQPSPGSGETPTPKKLALPASSSSSLAVDFAPSPINHQPPAKKRRAFRELQPPPTPPPPLRPPPMVPPQQMQPQQQPELPQYEPISPGPYEPQAVADNDADRVWRPW